MAASRVRSRSSADNVLWAIAGRMASSAVMDFELVTCGHIGWHVGGTMDTMREKANAINTADMGVFTDVDDIAHVSRAANLDKRSVRRVMLCKLQRLLCALSISNGQQHFQRCARLPSLAHPGDSS